MKIIIGLGNPEKKYELTRHNAGFMLVDKLQSQWEFPDFEFNKKFNAEISKNNLDLSLRAQRSNLEISNEIATSPTAPRNDIGKTLSKLEKEFEGVKKTYHKNMEGYKFGQVLGDLHAFVWHRMADIYIEELKEELKNGTQEVQMALEKTFLECITMLHPFIPFETEALWQVFKGEGSSILEINI